MSTTFRILPGGGETPALKPDEATPEPPAGGTPRTESGGKEPLLLHMPVSVRSMSIVLIAAIMTLYALQWAKELVVPILFGIMTSYALTPIVDRLERLRVPRAAAATCLLTAIVAIVCYGVWSLKDQVDSLTNTVPAVSVKIRELSKTATGGEPSTIERVQQAATELAAAAGATAPSSAASGVVAEARGRTGQPTPTAMTAPPVAPPRVDVRSYLLSGTLGILAFLGQLAMVYFLALFLLSSGNNFRRKMVKLAGPKLSQKKVTVETLDEISEHIQRYLMVQVGVSLAVGICTWLGFLALGMNNPGVWGVVAAVTNMIPYVGAVLVGAGSAIFALVQFGTPSMALAVGAMSFAVHTVIGNVLTPWWMGRASKMSPVAVFVAILVFGWLWGVSGLLLGVPILLVIKSVCDRVDDFKAVGELLGQ
jgi:predicted PurR-regulated permease PerM